MKRGLTAYLTLLVSCVCAWGRGELPRITFGAEWGYMPAFVTGYHYNFYDPEEGFRYDGKDSSMSYHTNGEVTLHVGYNINELWNLSVHAGYSGAAGFQPVIPLSLRGTRYWGRGHQSDRWFSFCDIGSGICLKKKPQWIFSTKLGSGYRISLSRHTKLDFIAALRFLYMHPDIIYYGSSLGHEWINRNDGYVGSLFLGIALTF